MALICAHTFKAAVAECVASAARMDKCRQAVRTVPAGWFYSYYSCCHNAIFLLEEQLTGSTYKTGRFLDNAAGSNSPQGGCSLSSMSVKPFSLTEDRYDQSTFMGRLSRIQSIFNPFLLTKSSADIEVSVFTSFILSSSSFSHKSVVALCIYFDCDRLCYYLASVPFY